MTEYNRAWMDQDPNLIRESEQYARPIPSREFLMQCLEEQGRSLSFEDLLTFYQLSDPDEQEGLRRRLIAMCRDGQLMRNRRGQYALVQQLELVRGHVQGHAEGFGFLIPHEGGPRIFLPEREMRSVLNDDLVLVRVLDAKARRPEGVIVEVLERHTHQVIGRYLEESGIALVDPDHRHMAHPILIPEDGANGAQLGQFVLVEIVAQPTRNRHAIGRIIQIFGDHLTPGMEVQLAIYTHQLPHIWPIEVQEICAHLTDSLAPEELAHRMDLRHLPFITIDGEDAQDFDDAIFCESNILGWKLYVAIADVSHYVTPGSVLDQEARFRGTSVYFPSQVVPMLPEILSNELCSLKPHQDRLVLVCIMDLDLQAEVTHFEFHNAVIRSQERLTYTEAAQRITSRLDSNLQTLNILYHHLLKKRKERGALEFDSLETKIQFDDKGKIEHIVPKPRNDAHRLIEEMMLSANVCAARFLLDREIPALYRVHESPDADAVLQLRQFLKNFQLRLSGGERPSTRDYSNLLKRTRNRKDAHLLQFVLLRSLEQARYTSDPGGHFGLAYPIYTHFTSPIRRYPDLLVHRLIKHHAHASSSATPLYTLKQLRQDAEHTSMTERRADRASRDALDWLKCEYMRHRLGQILDGRIVDVTNFGIFVELNELYIQGLVHMTSLKNDYYEYHHALHLLRGKRTGVTYRLSDPVRILVARVDLDRRAIHFELAH